MPRSVNWWRRRRRKAGPLDVVRLRESFAHVAVHGDELPLFFYSDLFLKHPEVRDMFPVSMAAQRSHLVDALVKIVSQVDSVDDLTAFLQGLGRDHRKFGAVAEHYDAVGASLLATLRAFLRARLDAGAGRRLEGGLRAHRLRHDRGGERGRATAAALVAGHGRGPRAEVLRCLRAARPAGAAHGLPAGAVRGDRVPEPPTAVALLLHGERTASGRAAGVPYPADRRRRGKHGAYQQRRSLAPNSGWDLPSGCSR